jgi:hypothetical protein
LSFQWLGHCDRTDNLSLFSLEVAVLLVVREDIVIGLSAVEYQQIGRCLL